MIKTFDLIIRDHPKGFILGNYQIGAIFFADFEFGDIPEISENAADNTMVTIVRVGEEFIATTDLPKVNRY